MSKIQVALSCIMAILISSAIPAAAVEVGQKAPVFELPSTKGGKLKLSNAQLVEEIRKINQGD